jgi:hypothetical protein
MPSAVTAIRSDLLSATTDFTMARMAGARVMLRTHYWSISIWVNGNRAR